jgi:hypothetical protein
MFSRFASLNRIRTARAMAIMLKRWESALGTDEQFGIFSMTPIYAVYPGYKASSSRQFYQSMILRDHEIKILRRMERSNPEVYALASARDKELVDNYNRALMNPNFNQQVKIAELQKRVNNLEESVNELTGTDRELATHS